MADITLQGLCVKRKKSCRNGDAMRMPGDQTMPAGRRSAPKTKNGATNKAFCLLCSVRCPRRNRKPGAGKPIFCRRGWWPCSMGREEARNTGAGLLIASEHNICLVSDEGGCVNRLNPRIGARCIRSWGEQRGKGQWFPRSGTASGSVALMPGVLRKCTEGVSLGFSWLSFPEKSLTFCLSPVVDDLQAAEREPLAHAARKSVFFSRSMYENPVFCAITGKHRWPIGWECVVFG